LIPANQAVEGNVGDTFWMEDEVRLDWEEGNLDCERFFHEPGKSALRKTLSFPNSQIEEYIVRKEQYPATDTGSQYLDPVWRQKLSKAIPQPIRLQMLISLN